MLDILILECYYIELTLFNLEKKTLYIYSFLGSLNLFQNYEMSKKHGLTRT